MAGDATLRMVRPLRPEAPAAARAAPNGRIVGRLALAAWLDAQSEGAP